MHRIAFIQLSDIHFVKSSGDPADIDKELRELIMVDIEVNAKNQIPKFDGVLLCGDIAFSGQEYEYKNAMDFLRQITSKLSIDISSVYCVPGNHDVDQKVAAGRKFIYDLQNKLDHQSTLDKADGEFERILRDEECKRIFFDPLQNYNNFATQFSCNIGAENLLWKASFNLDHGMGLNLYGMNSCLISNSDDNKVEGDKRLMYIGQNQIPGYEKNVVGMSLCHHPPECWKFKSDLLSRVNQRVDIQMYGHMHEQSITCNDKNLMLFSGATHPARGTDWKPCYNWITVECVLEEERRLIKVVVYPRILTEERDRFAPDMKVCKGKLYFEYFIDIDNKQVDFYSDKKYIECEEQDSELDISDHRKPENNYRKVTFCFSNMTMVEQRKILIEHGLFEEKYSGENYARYLKDIFLRAREKQVEDVLINKILGIGR